MAVSGINTVEYSVGTASTDWAAGTLTSPTTIAASDILKDGFSLLNLTEFLTELINETDELDGVKGEDTMNVKVDAANLPAEGATGVVFKITPESGAAYLLFGATGATIRFRAAGGVRPLSGGKWFKTMVATYPGDNLDAVLKVAT